MVKNLQTLTKDCRGKLEDISNKSFFNIIETEEENRKIINKL